MEKWVNYGSIDFTEDGGILLREAESDNCYEFVEVIAKNDCSYDCITGEINLDNYTEEEKLNMFYNGTGELPDNPMDIAHSIIDCIGGDCLRWTDWQVFTQQELITHLEGIGFPCVDDQLEEIRDGEKLFDMIRDYISQYGTVEHQKPELSNYREQFQNEVETMRELPSYEPDYIQLNKAELILKAIDKLEAQEKAAQKKESPERE